MNRLSRLTKTSLIMASVIAAPAFAGNTFSGNLTFVSDYAFRGVSQTVEEAAVQGTLEASLGNGMYAGLFGSNVSAMSYNNGNLETDLYAGWRGEIVTGWTTDIGIIAYLYPHAETATVETNKYDTTEFYVGVSKDWFSAKYSYALTDFFGINDDNVPAHLDTGIAAGHGDSNGADYLEVNANLAVAEGWTLALHAGHQSVAGYSKLDYSDVRIGLNWTAISEENLVLGLTWTTTDAEDGYYTVVDAGSNVRIADDRWILSVSRSF